MTQIPFAELRSWLFQDALPFWAEAGVDSEAGGFREELGLDGRPTAVAFKRLRAVCRQTYVFTHAALMGWAPGAALSTRGYEYLLAHARLQGGGWARLLTREGAVLDPRQDLYDLAFVLFAMAWRYRLTGDAEALAHARDVLSFIQREMRHGEGFLHLKPPEGPRMQNPHMHLLEASLVAFEASGDERFLDQARELVALFRTRLFDGRSLGERFSESWARVRVGEGVEPGHMFEWAWILGQHQRLSGDAVGAEALALVAFAERHGVDPQTSAVYDAVSEDGAPLRTSSRAWPNTERLKAHLALFELEGRAPHGAASSARLLLDRYLAPAPRGSWVDQFDQAGQPIATAAPASTLYHMTLAISEALRLEPALGA